MKTLKKMILLTVLMSMVGGKALAFDAMVDGIYYNFFSETEAEVTFYNYPNNESAYTGSIVIPPTVIYNGTTYPVTRISSYAFYHCSGLTSVTIPNSVTSIGWQAFSYCSGLTSVTIPSSVTSIGEYAFESCSGLTSVTIPNSVTSIGGHAFSGCSGLTSVTIPNSVTSIGGYAFSSCSGLTSVTIPNSVTSIGVGTFSYCSGLTSVTIPNSVTSIGKSAFNNCGLTSVTIPNSVTSIGDGAFGGCFYLTSVTIPNSVTSIGSQAFAGCFDLTSVTIPNSVTSIGDSPFSSCRSLTSIQVALDNTVYDSRNDCNAIIETASNTLIAGCQNTVIPNSVTSIGYKAFYGCSNLKSIYIPNTVTRIDREAFYDRDNQMSVTVMWETPIQISYDVFINRKSSTLYVPYSCKNAYLAADYWRDFKVIEMSSQQLISATGISLDSSSLTFDAYGQTATLTATITPADATFKTIIWSSSDTDVVTVDQAGVVTATGNGTAIITAKTKDGTNLSAQCNVTVDIHTANIAMKTSSGDPRTMIGYSSKYGLDFTNVPDVKACIAVGFSDKKNVLLTNVKIVPANTGIVLIVPEDKAGMEFDVPITTNDYYYANLLQPAVKDVTIQPSETIDGVDYTNLMVGKDSQTDELGFISFTSPVIRSNNCYLRVPTSFYQSASAARQGGGLGIEFVDSESTDIQPLIQNGAVNDGVYYDLQGRKVTPTKKGLYISNGKKVFIK